MHSQTFVFHTLAIMLVKNKNNKVTTSFITAFSIQCHLYNTTNLIEAAYILHFLAYYK